MSFIPVLVMGGLLLIITTLLAVADKLLVSYGECKIFVQKQGEDQEFTVEGGDNLLTYLSEHGIDINSSCGGKGSCGYCKVRVLDGGGPILPTEEIYMSRQEMQENMRLACQVKVKNDVTIRIPDYLAVIRQMVVNKKIDTSKRWKVTIN